MSTLAIVATLDGWTDIKSRLQVSSEGRRNDYLFAAAAGLRQWKAGGGAFAEAGLRAASSAMGGCASVGELEQLRAEGLVDCGVDTSSGLVAQCPSTCAPQAVATALLVPFIVIAQVIDLPVFFWWCVCSGEGPEGGYENIATWKQLGLLALGLLTGDCAAVCDASARSGQHPTDSARPFLKGNFVP